MIGAYVAALAVGILMVMVRSARLFVGKMNVRVFTDVVVKLITAGNPDRALKLCAAVPRAYFARMVEPVLRSFGDIDASLGSSLVREEIRARFDRERNEQLGRARSGSWMSVLGVALAAAGAAALTLESTDSRFGYSVIAAFVALMACLWSFTGVSRLARRSVTQGERIIAAVADWHLGVRSSPAPEPSRSVGASLGSGLLTFSIRGPDGRQREETLGDSVIKIGKLADAHLSLDDDRVSRMHAVIERDDNGTTIIDLGSAGGTLVNGSRVVKKALQEGDEIQVGGTSIVITAAR